MFICEDHSMRNFLMMINKIKGNIRTLLLVLVCFTGKVYSQSGGNNIYNFLNLVPSARITAMGGYYPAVVDADLNLGTFNPSLLNNKMNNQLALNYLNYVAGINYGMVAYGFDKEKYGTFCASLQYINYGKFIQTDETSTQTGTFTGGEYALSLGWGLKLDSVFRVGVNFKPVYSSIAGYNSFGLATDFGATYIKPDKNFSASFLVRNLGFQVTKYYAGNKGNLPLDIQLGLVQKLKHVPLRLSLVATNLQKYKLTYTDTVSESQVDPLTNQVMEPKKKTGENIMRHFVIGTEFLLTQNFNLRIGYNFNRRQDLKVDTRTGLSGFSFGAGIKISKFIIGYSHSFFHLAGGEDMFSLSMNFNEFKKKSAN